MKMDLTKAIQSTFRILICIILIGLSSSCNKKLDITSSQQVYEANHWKTFEDARSGLFGLYGLLRASLASNNAHWLWGELRQGDFSSVSRSDLKALINGNLKASYPLLEDITNWRRFYAVINACNLFIERSSECLTDLRYTPAYHRLDMAQARAIRAFSYFYIVRIWGDVPLITSSQDGGDFEEYNVTNKEVVLDFVQKELITIAPQLPFLYSGADPDNLFPPNYYGRSQINWRSSLINKLGVYSVLAHVAAWRGRYLETATYTEFVLNNFSKVQPTGVSVITVPELTGSGSFFLNRPSNYRQLLSFGFSGYDYEYSIDGHIENLTIANTVNFSTSKQLPDIYVTKETIRNIFLLDTTTDTRFGVDAGSRLGLYTTNYFENFDSEIPVFKKIRVVYGGISKQDMVIYNSSIVFSRYEEVLLLDAEANAANGNILRAATSLNEIRKARNIKLITSQNQNDIIDAVFDERRRELMGEGWRWYDQVRYNRLRRKNPTITQLIANEGIYWPIASDVLFRNKKLTQNNYWK